MARTRFEKLEPERQEVFLRAAAEEFAERGFEAASLNRIVEASGTSKGSLYYYFEDKSDLFSTVVETATETIIRLAGGFSIADLTAETYWPTLDAFVGRTARALEGNAWYVKLARAFYGMRGPTAGKTTGRVFGLARHWTRQVVARGQELGVVRTDLPLDLLVEVSLAVGEAGDRWLLENWDGMSEKKREAMVMSEMSLFRRILGWEEMP